MPHILIFDSGVGGLSIAAAVQQQHPHCSLIYASDNAAFPYGTKTEDELITRVDHVLHALHKHCRPDIIVVACNTASTLALPTIRERFDLPIVGVVPAIKPAAAISKSKVIGLLATPATITRPYTQALIGEHAGECKVIPLGTSELVHLAEIQLRQPDVMEQDEYQLNLQSLLAPFAEATNMDTVVLACTHFPLLREPLATALPDIQYWVDSGDAIGRRVGYWLDELSVTNRDGYQPSHRSLFTAQEEAINSLRPCLQARGLGTVEFLELPAPSHHHHSLR